MSSPVAQLVTECHPGVVTALEPDVWPPGSLDREPESCWCLSCGAELPCLTCKSSTDRPTNPPERS
jgi:hypothetical protein